MRIFITGASGFLGSHVAEAAAAAGHTPVALVRKRSNVDFLKTIRGIEFAHGSIEDLESLKAGMKGVDAVVHAAGLVKAKTPDEFMEVNAGGTKNALEAAKAVAPGLKRFVYVSSLAAVGPSPDGRPIDPSTRNPLTHYGRSKRAGEDHVDEEQGRLPVITLRPPMIYGPRDRESFAFFQSVSRRFLPYLGAGTNTMSVIYGADAAAACLAAIASDVPSGNKYFMDDGKIYVWKDMLKDIEAAIGKPALVRFSIPFGAVKIAAVASEMMGKVTGEAVMLTRDKLKELSADHWVCDSMDTRRDLHWTPQVDWAKGTRLSAIWYKENGWL